MTRTAWLIAAFVCSIAIALIHNWAVASYIYWHFVWFDVPVHYLGGLTIGAFTVALLKTRRSLLFMVIIAAIIIGWEIFEYYIGVPRQANYWFDTWLDILMGTFGATITYVIARYTIWRSV